MSTYFISDLHLDPQQPQTLVALTRFLQGIVDHTDALYILGDLISPGRDRSGKRRRPLEPRLRRF